MLLGELIMKMQFTKPVLDLWNHKFWGWGMGRTYIFLAGSSGELMNTNV